MAELPSGEGTNNGITVSMVGATLGTTSKDVGRLCTNQNINKWSKHKPVKFAKLSGLTEEDFKAAKYGLIVPYVQQMDSGSYFNLAVIKNMMNNNQNWSYQPPTGGASSPYRLGDFRRYKHDAVPPIYSNYGKTWEDKPYKAEYIWRQVSTNIHQLAVSFYLGSAKEEGANQWNLKFDDFSFSVFNEQDSLVNLENAHLMIAVFDGHVDPFSETFNKTPIVWIVSNHPTTNVDHGLQFHLPATAFTTAGQLSNNNPIITAKTLVFMLGVNMNYTTTSAVFRLYDDTSPWSYKAGENFPTHYPSYCVSLPFDKQHYPVIWLDEYNDSNIDAIYFNRSETYWHRSWWNAAVPKQYIAPGTGTDDTYTKYVGGYYWLETADEITALYNGNTNDQDNRLFISILLHNRGTNDFTFYKNKFYAYRYFPHPDQSKAFNNKTAQIDYFTYASQAENPNVTTYTIPAGGSKRIYMAVHGISLPSSSTVPFTVTFKYNGTDTYGTVEFKATTNSIYNFYS